MDSEIHRYKWYCVFGFISASMARKIYLRHGIGVGAFRKIYGGSQRNGSRPPHFCKSSGSIARHILQQLEKMNIIEMDPNGWVPQPFYFRISSSAILANRLLVFQSCGQRVLKVLISGSGLFPLFLRHTSIGSSMVVKKGIKERNKNK